MKFALVTGASTGIGKEVAIELAKSDFQIGLVGRNIKKLNEVKSIIEKSGGKTLVFTTDLSNLENTKQLVENVKKVTNKVDLIANIAGIWHNDTKVFAGINYKNFDDQVLIDTMNVGIVSPLLLVRGLLTIMPTGSSVINLSGTFEDGAKGWLPYYVSKRAIEDFTVGLSDELKDKGVMANCISPSDTATESYSKFFPEYAKNSQDPKEVAKLIVKIISGKDSGKIWVVKNKCQPSIKFHR